MNEKGSMERKRVLKEEFIPTKGRIWHKTQHVRCKIKQLLSIVQYQLIYKNFVMYEIFISFIIILL